MDELYIMHDKSPLVSFLIPTRGKEKLLMKSIKSLLDRASGIESWEVIIIIDNDDFKTLNTISEIESLFEKYSFCDCKISISEPKGYINLDYYYNKAAKLSTGELVCVWNDDVVMNSFHWDLLLRGDSERWPEKMCFMPIEVNIGLPQWINTHTTNFGGFPIVRKSWLDLLGYLVADYRVDSYIFNVCLISPSIHYEQCRLCVTHHNWDGPNDRPSISIQNNPEEFLIYTGGYKPVVENGITYYNVLMKDQMKMDGYLKENF